MSLHVLVVARWYPSHDDPGRGSFVADHVAALRDAGLAVTVASFDPTGVRGPEATRPARGADAAVALESDLATPDALNRPRSWGAAGVAVARLPVILDGSRRRPSEVVEAHARALVPFGVGLHDRLPVDVIHAHTGLPDGLAAARLADRLTVPLLTSEHSSTIPDELGDPEAADLYRTLLGHGRGVVAVSRQLGVEVAERLGFGLQEVGVLPNALPVASFPPGDAADRDPGELLYVGSRKASKGIETLLRAFAELLIDHPTLRLRLIGAPGPAEDEARWRGLVDDLGIGAAVTIEGRASREAVARAMRRAAVFVHPSPRETFGMVAAEAIASGLPVAATPSGGVDEIVSSDGSGGEVAASTTPGALAEAVRRVIARRESFDPLGMHARMAGSFAAPAVAARTVGVYEDLLHVVGRVPSRPRPTAQAEPVSEAGTGAGRAPWQPPLVVAFSRDLAIERIRSLPAPLAAQLTVATLADGKAAPSTGQWLSLHPDRTYQDRLAALGGPAPEGLVARTLAAVLTPGVRRRRHELFARRAELRQETTDGFLTDALASAGRPPFVLALDADDVLVAAPLVASGTRLAPGGLRWLVDAWDDAGRPGDRTA